jgi:hypothetical protein
MDDTMRCRRAAAAAAAAAAADDDVSCIWRAQRKMDTLANHDRARNCKLTN